MIMCIITIVGKIVVLLRIADIIYNFSNRAASVSQRLLNIELCETHVEQFIMRRIHNFYQGKIQTKQKVKLFSHITFTKIHLFVNI